MYVVKNERGEIIAMASSEEDAQEMATPERDGDVRTVEKLIGNRNLSIGAKKVDKPKK
jgi:hypothetical protein